MWYSLTLTLSYINWLKKCVYLFIIYTLIIYNVTYNTHIL